MNQIEIGMRRLLPVNQWRSPAEERVEAALVEIPQGLVALYRSPGRIGGIEAAAERWERWEFVGDDNSFNASLRDAAAPGALLWKRARQGIGGEVDGAEFSVSGRTSFRPGRREVRFHFTADDRALVFRRTGSGVALVRREPDGGEVPIALEVRSGKWSGTDIGMDAVAAVVVYVSADLEYFLESPLLRML